MKESSSESAKAGRFPIVYLPLEFQSREMDSKTLLAATLAQRGYTVLFGQQWMLYQNIDRLPPGVFLFKSFNKIHQPAMCRAKQAGHRVAALEEELFAQIDEKAITAFCTDGLFESADLILANGSFEFEILTRRSGGRVQVAIAGNGRVDVLKPNFRSFFDPQVDAIKRRFGDFVLINTNFGNLNSIWGGLEQATEIQRKSGFINDSASMQVWQDFISFERANQKATLSAISMLAERRPEQTIVIRPHPGEDLKKWDGLFPGRKNIHVAREGSHVPWTLACRLLLHPSCTTGFEAYLAERPALSLVPEPSWVTECFISNLANPVFGNPEAFIDAAEKILDGGEVPRNQLTIKLQDYVWNETEKDSTGRIADLLTEELPPPAAISLPSLSPLPLDDRLKEKFNVTIDVCRDVLRRVQAIRKIDKLELQSAGEGLFLLSRADFAPIQISRPLKMNIAQVQNEMNAALNARKFDEVNRIFCDNFGETHRYPDLCFVAGIALSELGKNEVALQYFQQATVAAGQVVNHNYAFSLARTYEKLKDYENAWRYAQLAYQMVPVEPNFFALYKHLCVQTKRNVPEHWIVIGCSHVRYFRYMQINQPKFFGRDAHLECYEFGGATAYGLGNPNSDSGALSATRQLRERIATADRVLINFGEIDCRRAAWKAASVSKRPVEEHIAESAKHLAAYIEREILPFNRKVLLIGAKPQIIGDQDFYRASLEDERTIFKPLPEREQVTLDYNAKLKATAERLKLDYVDLDDILKDEKSRRHFFDRVFWDDFTDDTHGNVDFFAGLYFERLKKFTGKPRPVEK